MTPAPSASTGPWLSRLRGTPAGGATLSVAAFSSAHEALTAAAAELGGDGVGAAFQHPVWLANVYRHLVAATGAQPLCLGVRSAPQGPLLAVLPLLVRREGRLRVARFADCGVSDYNAPLRSAGGLGSLTAAHLLAALKPALNGIDMLALDRMPVTPLDPLSLHPAAQPARLHGNRLTIADGVDGFLRARGKKYRKEVERCTRLLTAAGDWSFARATTGPEIEQAYATLEVLQAERHAGAGDYALAEPRFETFYRALLADPSGLGHIYTLSVDGAIIAVLLGIEHGATFTLLRIAHSGGAWRQMSPGRLIVVEAMRAFCARGVTTFDLGMGDYAFKRGFGAQAVPLADLVVPLTARAVPTVAAFRLKSRLRRNERLRTLVQRLRGTG